MPLSEKCHQALAARPDPVKDKTRAAEALKKRQLLREAAERQARQLIEARLAFAEDPKVLRGLVADVRRCAQASREKVVE